MSNIFKGIQLNEADPRNFDSDIDYYNALNKKPRGRSEDDYVEPGSDYEEPIKFKQDPNARPQYSISKDEDRQAGYNMTLTVKAPTTQKAQWAAESFVDSEWGAKKQVGEITTVSDGVVQVHMIDNHKYGMWKPWKDEEPTQKPISFNEEEVEEGLGDWVKNKFKKSPKRLGRVQWDDIDDPALVQQQHQVRQNAKQTRVNKLAAASNAAQANMAANPTPSSVAGNNAFGNMASQLAPNKPEFKPNSAGGMTAQTSTGLVHAPGKNNPNAQPTQTAQPAQAQTPSRQQVLNNLMNSVTKMSNKEFNSFVKFMQKQVLGRRNAGQVTEEQLDELSPQTLASYKKKAGADASAADKAGDYERGNKRFSGIVRATKKEFDNDAKSSVQAKTDDNLRAYYAQRKAEKQGVAEGWKEEAQELEDWSKEVNMRLYRAHESQRLGLARQLSKLEQKHFGSEFTHPNLTNIVWSALRALQKGEMVHYDPERVGQMPFGNIVGDDAKIIAQYNITREELAGYRMLHDKGMVDNLDQFLKLRRLVRAKSWPLEYFEELEKLTPEEAWLKMANDLNWSKDNMSEGMSEEKQRLDPKCWKGYKKQGTKMKGDTRVNNCVPVKESKSNILKGLM